MQILIGNVLENIKVTSHILEPNYAEPDKFSLFHCWGCGNVLHQFGGDCIMSFPGSTKTLLPIIIMCRKCKRRHLFNSIL